MILIVNAGSSSLKIKVFGPDLRALISGTVTEIGGKGTLSLGPRKEACQTQDHSTALAAMLAALEDAGFARADLTAVGHRIVHGGTALTQPVRVTDEVTQTIEALFALAPLHNPPGLHAIRALAALLPDLPQCASFDTAFHASNPDLAQRYAIPQPLHDAGIRRYGFHGLSYAGMVASFGAALPPRLLAFHLGNGASLCAIKDGQSVATTMGYSPLSGLTMGTRSGDIDGAAILRLVQELGVAETEATLNRRSGLLGLAGDSDMRALLARDDAAARDAVAHFCYWAARYAGSAIVAMGGLDAIAFTGGIGENAPQVRDAITAQLDFLGSKPVHVVMADEELQIARDVARLVPEVL